MNLFLNNNFLTKLFLNVFAILLDGSLAGSGVFFDLGPHLIDQAVQLFGVPSSIRADLKKMRQGSANDYFDVQLCYENNPELKVTCKATVISRIIGPRFIVHGMQGSFVKYGLDPQEDALKSGKLPVNEGAQWGQENKEAWGQIDTEVNDVHVTGKIETIPGNYLLYYESVYDAIVNGKELAVKPEEAAMIIKLIELAQVSNEKGGVKVEVK